MCQSLDGDAGDINTTKVKAMSPGMPCNLQGFKEATSMAVVTGTSRLGLMPASQVRRSSRIAPTRRR